MVINWQQVGIGSGNGLALNGRHAIAQAKVDELIEAETSFRRRHFQMHFLEWKCFNSD